MRFVLTTVSLAFLIWLFALSGYSARAEEAAGTNTQQPQNYSSNAPNNQQQRYSSNASTDQEQPARKPKKHYRHSHHRHHRYYSYDRDYDYYWRPYYYRPYYYDPYYYPYYGYYYGPGFSISTPFFGLSIP